MSSAWTPLGTQQNELIRRDRGKTTETGIAKGGSCIFLYKLD
jgi:hypothetical protein